MPLHLFESAALPSMPWKNGGGTTREITCQPVGSSVHDFAWRLSIAEIAASGPFSAFAGVDRVITLLEGDGVHLHGASAGVDHLLNQPLQPFAFSGDVALDCDVLGGVCQDFNVMVRRSYGVPCVAVYRSPWHLPAQGAALVRGGQWQLVLADGCQHTLTVQAQDGAFWHALPEGARLLPMTADACLLGVSIAPHF